MTSPPPVLLNHFFVSPGEASFRALEESRLVRQLAAVEKRTTVRRDQTYTGLYLYGRHTYFEFLAPGSTMLGASSGIAFGVEQAGEVERVCEALHTAEVSSTLVQPVNRALPSGGETAWFRSCALDLEPAGSSFASWVMEYEPAFFTRFRPELPPGRATRARADALVRYAAACGQQREREQGLFEDVVALELSLTPAGLVRLEKQCAALSLAVDRSARGLVCQGDDIQLIATASASARGVTAARLRLRRDAGRSEQRIGTTTLTLDGQRAVWRF